MPRKQLNIGLTPEQRAQVDEIATALDTTPTEFARSAILETVQLQRALTAEDRADVLAAAAAIDRVVHHSVILEFDVPSYRTNAAQQRGQAEEVNRQN